MRKRIWEVDFLFLRGYREKRLGLILQAQSSRLCCSGKIILCQSGGNERGQHSICEGSMGAFWCAKDKRGLQDERPQTWIEIQEDDGKAKPWKDTTPADCRKREMGSHQKGPTPLYQ